ncbi:MAG: outer membrane protein assembly factor BamD [Holophagaceae bacterium]|nr:outer membrane protein assembly factor BamD [Holophagaceae bacterium]
MKLLNRNIAGVSLAIIAIANIAGLGVGCSNRPKAGAARIYTGSLTAPQLLEKGTLELHRKKWEDGRRTLKLIEEFLPGAAEFPAAKLLLADSYFYGSKSSFPEAEVEYQSLLNYFPNHPKREYVLYRIALCRYASIENGERDQTATHKAIEAFNRLLQESPGTPYATDARAKITQCWKRLAEHELVVGIFYVNSFQWVAAENRLKGMLETYPEYSDRERAYFYLGEALRRKNPGADLFTQEYSAFLDTINKQEEDSLTAQERKQWVAHWNAFAKAEVGKYTAEARSYFQRLVESYPSSIWAGRARDRLLELGQTRITEELDG